MKFLALDTSTEACSAALYVDGDIREQFQISPRGHGQLILKMVDHLLADAQLKVTQLDGIAFGRGPGAFTGVRISTSVVQGIAFGADLPVVPVSSLAALAQGAYRQFKYEAVLAAFDARMDEVYWGAFEVQDGLMQPVIDESVCRPHDVPLLDSKVWHGVGSGWKAYGDELSARYENHLESFNGDCLPHAEDVALLAKPLLEKGETVIAEQALPIYLRDNVVKVKAG